jgi:stage III sporulation protein AG
MMKKWFRRDNLIVMVLAGILLFIVALPTRESGADALDIQEAEDDTELTGTESGGMSGAYEDYAELQEEKLKNILTSMEGVGEVEVMLTFLSSEELVVEKDEPTTRSNTVEKDSEGGTRTVTQYEKGDSTVYHSASGEGEPYVVKTLNPRVEGVLVVAEGAGDGTVNRSITEIAQALFGVEAHKVKVVPMDSIGSAGGTGD